MKKKFRLKDNKDFTRIIKANQYIINKSFVLYYQVNELNYSRFGISVGKKHGNAVTRNKIKRQLRMMISKIFNYGKSYDYVIMIRKNYKELNFLENEKSLLELYIKLDK